MGFELQLCDEDAPEAEHAEDGYEGSVQEDWLTRGAGGRKLTLVAHPVVGEHAEAGQHAVARADVGCCEQEGVDLDALLEQWQHGPLIAVVLVIPLHPSGNRLVYQIAQSGTQTGLRRGDLIDPARICMRGDRVQAQFANDPREQRRGG